MPHRVRSGEKMPVHVSALLSLSFSFPQAVNTSMIIIEMYVIVFMAFNISFFKVSVKYLLTDRGIFYQNPNLQMSASFSYWFAICSLTPTDASTFFFVSTCSMPFNKSVLCPCLLTISLLTCPNRRSALSFISVKFQCLVQDQLCPACAPCCFNVVMNKSTS